ncbi:MFS transporter, partial [Corynebacterium sp.]|uniref:MFS transporter n=1 Tax=Corynebacterium sp. TaxID=1720 RepID=UPI002A915F83
MATAVSSDALVPRLSDTVKVLAASAFIIALGYGFIAPILPQFTASFGVSLAAAGAVVSIFAAARLIGAPGAGLLVDRLGSRPVYLTGLFIVAGATFLVAFAQAYWHIFALRFIAGFGSTMFTLSAQALIVRVTHPSIRGRANAMYATAFLLGNIIGPVIGAALSFLGFRIPFAIYGIVVALAAVLVWVATSTTRGKVVLPPRLPPMPLEEAAQSPTYQSLLASGFTNGWANFGVRASVLPLFAAAVFANGGAAAGLALTAFAVGTAISLQ